MQRMMCKSKIHSAIITDANLRYEGSVTIAADLLEAAQIAPYERLQIVNLHNGARLETYCLAGPSASGTVCLNGAAARRAAIGDEVLIISYALMEERELASHRPTIVFLDGKNHIRDIATYDNSHVVSRTQRFTRAS